MGVTAGAAAERTAVRFLDVTVASLVLVVMLPVLLVITIAIRIDSDGPAILRQQRVGRHRRAFTMFKFRTMFADADPTPHHEFVRALIGASEPSVRGRLYKLTGDARVTSVGRRLRSWSLDELPQLINVLRGEMSLVGPRPVIVYEASLYPDSYLGRFAVKPGMTGLWQVSGRNERTYDEMVRIDIDYSRRASLWLDLKILARTIPAVLGRRGAV